MKKLALMTVVNTISWWFLIVTYFFGPPYMQINLYKTKTLIDGYIATICCIFLNTMLCYDWVEFGLHCKNSCTPHLFLPDFIYLCLKMPLVRGGGIRRKRRTDAIRGIPISNNVVCDQFSQCELCEASLYKLLVFIACIGALTKVSADL